MKNVVFLSGFIFFGLAVFAQTNIRCTNPEMEKVLTGNYDREIYTPGQGQAGHGRIICDIQDRLNADSLRSYLITLETFYTRHTYSDTASSEHGIGAARRWALDLFDNFSNSVNNRLLTGYLQFDFPGGSCGDGVAFKNILAVLPGIDQDNHELIIIEAHIDTRCEDPCDVNCLAAGIEDNGSGTALVLELARVMSAHAFNKTIVFMLTIGEEQGLYGAKAMAKYCQDKSIKIKGVLNNDVVGGITCGETSSPPSCEGEGNVDSTQVRIFSNGGLSLPHRSLARTIQMYYNEKLKPITDVPMTVSIMDQEDRTGRGGDHIPFREKGYPSIRFTAANEHGDAHPDTDYKDRQHSVRDVLGADTDGDQKPDIFYVDFNYLKRNAVINGTTAALLAVGPATPLFKVHDEASGLRVEITGGFTNSYRIAVRALSAGQNFDAVYRTDQKSFVIPNLEASTGYRVSVAAIDANGVMSPFSGEVIQICDVKTAGGAVDVLDLGISCYNSGVRDPFFSNKNAFKMSCLPNPSKGVFTIKIETSTNFDRQPASVVIRDINGKELQNLPFQFHSGMVEVAFDVELAPGSYVYSLVIDGMVAETKKLIAQ